MIRTQSPMPRRLATVRPLPKSRRSEQDKLNECSRRRSKTFVKENGRKFRGFDAPEGNVEAVKIACEKPYSEGVLEERSCSWS